MSKRPIEFRAWNKTSKSMILDPTEYSETQSYSIDNDIDVLPIHINNVFSKENELEWMQFTGLLDKNGTKIFEGDILRHHMKRIRDDKPIHHDSVVEWEMSVGYDEPGIGYQLNAEEMGQQEVVGNIYENPDLLEK